MLYQEFLQDHICPRVLSAKSAFQGGISAFPAWDTLESSCCKNVLRLSGRPNHQKLYLRALLVVWLRLSNTTRVIKTHCEMLGHNKAL